ncbi:hypothetical protein [Mesorhizobium sp. WSM3224]|uniref:hypothetical protein n=1 Tax=Mesorhizobium sp. WSM3224 TaxID=1040986 RepID=UPI0032AF0C09
MLAGKYLAATDNFQRSVSLIFQPAEEDVDGGQGMGQEGIIIAFPRFLACTISRA